MRDLRRLLRARTPEKIGRGGKTIQVNLSSDDYELLWNMAFDADRSLADQVRALIRQRKGKVLHER